MMQKLMLNTENTSFAKRLLRGQINLAAVLYLSLATVVFNCATAAEDDPQETILVIGDSISAAYGLALEDGWVALLEQRLQDESPDWRVVNASVTGDTSGNGLGRLADLLDEYDPRMVIIELGGNDGLRGLSIKKLQENLTAMAEMTNTVGATPVIVAVQLPGNYGKAFNRLFNNSFTAAAEATDAILIPSLFEGMTASNEWFQADGIHPSAKAQAVMLENVWKQLEPALDQVQAQ